MIFENKLCHTNTNIITKVKIIHTYTKKKTHVWPLNDLWLRSQPQIHPAEVVTDTDFYVTRVTRRSCFICCHGDVRLEETGSKHQVPWLPLLWTQHRRTSLSLIVPQTNKQSWKEQISLSCPFLVSFSLWPADLVPSSCPQFQSQAKVTMYETLWCVWIYKQRMLLCFQWMWCKHCVLLSDIKGRALNFNY